MHIGIDIKTLKNRTSGIQVYLRNMLDALQALDTVNDYTLYEQTPSDYRITNPRWKKRLLPSRLPGTVWLQLHVAPRLCRDGITLFWGPEQMCPLIKPSSVKYATTIHDFTFRHFPKTVRFTNRLVLGLTSRRICTVSDLLLAVSDRIRQETRDYLEHIRNSETVVETVPNAAPQWRIPEGYRAENRGDALLYIGNIEPRKNLMRLIDALELLRNRGHTPQLVIVGGLSWKSAAFMKKMATTPVKEQIRLCGYLPTDALQHELLTCKALVFPSLYEGFGIPVLEALSLDCMVLTSKGTAMEQIAGTCALYFDPYSPDDIADCIESMYLPSFSRTPYLANRESVLERYTWRASAQRLLAVFGNLFGCENPAATKY